MSSFKQFLMQEVDTYLQKTIKQQQHSINISLSCILVRRYSDPIVSHVLHSPRSSHHQIHHSIHSFYQSLHPGSDCCRFSKNIVQYILIHLQGILHEGILHDLVHSECFQTPAWKLACWQCLYKNDAEGGICQNSASPFLAQNRW